jgi:hypothetical protein
MRTYHWFSARAVVAVVWYVAPPNAIRYPRKFVFWPAIKVK